MEYIALLKGVLLEAFEGLQYKRLPVGVRALTLIGLLPFILLAAIYAGVLAVWSLWHAAIFCAADYLEAWLESKRAGLGVAAEAVLYLVALPAIVLLRLTLALTTILLFFVWFFLQAFLYIATLGGICWQPFLNRVAARERHSLASRTDPTLGTAIALLLFAFFALYVFCVFLGTFAPVFVTAASAVELIYTLFAAIAVPLCFRKGPALPADMAE